MKLIFHRLSFLIFSIVFCSAQKDITLTYDFERDIKNKGILYVKAKITNNTESDFYFLTESCNDLDYYLSTNSELAEIQVWLHCRATFPRKVKLEPNSSYDFNTIIGLKKNIKELTLVLKLVELSKTYEIKEKFLGKVREENIQRTFIVESLKVNTIKE